MSKTERVTAVIGGAGAALIVVPMDIALWGISALLGVGFIGVVVLVAAVAAWGELGDE